MSTDPTSPYSRAELQSDPPFPPERGEACPHCGMNIPDFADLAEADLLRVRRLLAEGRTMTANHELRTATDAPQSFVDLWIAHRGRPLPPEGAESTPCPHCGKPLRTHLAKQCRHCKRDWHAPREIKSLR